MNSLGNLDWIKIVEIQITGSANDGSTPPTKLASYTTTTEPGSEISVDVVMNGDQVLKYLESGPITLGFTLSGSVDESDLPSGDLSESASMCVSVSGKFSKSL